MLSQAWQIYTYESVDSTMESALQHIAGESPFAVLACTQTNGRGRQGRSWDPLDGNLFTTLAFKPSQACSTWWQISFVAALAVGQVVQDSLLKLQSPSKMTYKWPNDILVSGKKMAGILLEVLDPSWLFVGIGLNLQKSPSHLDQRSTSLKEEQGYAPLPEEALSLLIKYFTETMALLDTKGFSEIKDRWLKSAAYLGEKIEINLHRYGQTEKMSGKFITLDEEGRLLLELPNMEIKKISSGDVLLQV